MDQLSTLERSIQATWKKMSINSTENLTMVFLLDNVPSDNQRYLAKIVTLITAGLAATGIVTNLIVVVGLANRNLKTYVKLVQS